MLVASLTFSALRKAFPSHKTFLLVLDDLNALSIQCLLEFRKVYVCVAVRVCLEVYVQFMYLSML